jgi:hypothetical protein
MRSSTCNNNTRNNKIKFPEIALNTKWNISRPQTYEMTLSQRLKAMEARFL